MSNHGQQVHWNKGTLDVNKYRDKLNDIEESTQQLDVTKLLIEKKAESMTYKLQSENATHRYNEKIENLKKMQE